MLEANEVIKSLINECLAYQKHGLNVSPIRVKEMIKEAFEAKR